MISMIWFHHAIDQSQYLLWCSAVFQIRVNLFLLGHQLHALKMYKLMQEPQYQQLRYKPQNQHQQYLHSRMQGSYNIITCWNGWQKSWKCFPCYFSAITTTTILHSTSSSSVSRGLSARFQISLYYWWSSMCHTSVPNRCNMLLYYDGRTVYSLRIVSIIHGGWTRFKCEWNCWIYWTVSLTCVYL